MWIGWNMHWNHSSFQPLEKHLKSWKQAPSLKSFHKSFMPFFITPAIMRWTKDLILLFRRHFEVIMSYFAPVYVTSRSRHSTTLMYDFSSCTFGAPTICLQNHIPHYAITCLSEAEMVFCGRLLLYLTAKLCENPKRMNTDKLRLMAPVSDKMNVLMHPPSSLTWVETYLYCISLCPAEAEEEWARCKHLTQSSSSISWYLSFCSSVEFPPCNMRFNTVSGWDNPKYRSQPW